MFQATYYQSKRCRIPEDNNTVLTTIENEREGKHAGKKTDASWIAARYSCQVSLDMLLVTAGRYH